MGDPPAEPGATDVEDNEDRRRRRSGWLRRSGWRGTLYLVLIGAAGGMAINDFSNTMGFPGLAGDLAIAGVLAATIWLRKLPPKAPLARQALWLFLTPAAAAALVAALSTGRVAGILAALAVILTAGAVLLATDLEAAVELARQSGTAQKIIAKPAPLQ